VRRSVLLFLSLSLLAVLVAGAATLEHFRGAGNFWTTADTPRLIVPAPSQLVEQVLQVGVGPKIIAGDMFFCLDRPGSITVDDVEPVGDLRMTAYAIRANPFLTGGNMAGTQKGTLHANHIENNPGPLTTVCSQNSGQGYELVTELNISDRTTSASGFRIRYHAEPGGSASMLVIRLGITYCSATDTTEDCHAQPSSG
jgi:hypothetical protein